MKYGLLYYKDTDNIGDDIQAYAASRFLPQVDYMIDREKLNDFIPKKKEYVKTIMNAWYIHDKLNFNISPYISPLFISMFFKRFPYEAGITVGIDYINQTVVRMFKEYGPVGTRDKHTLNIMNELGVDSYFSGCMTLTLDRFENVKQGDYIVVVGLKQEEIDYIKSITKREVIEFIQDVPKGSFSDESWDKRKDRVIETLKLYQGAHMVITNKLHCSLPCLALETPVLLLYDDSFPENIDRIGTYLPYLNHINRKDLYNIDINLERPKKNPKKYLELRNNLIQKCNDFIADDYIPKTNSLIDVESYNYMNDRNSIQKKIILNHLNKLSSLYEKECLKSSKMYDEFMSEISKLKSENEELSYRLNSILNSKGWRLLEKIRHIKKKNSNYIKIVDVISINKKLIIKYDVSGSAKCFFENGVSLEIDYEFNLSNIPKSILVIPFLSLFLPVAWITKSDIILDEIDESFLNNLEKIRAALNDMYDGNMFKKVKIKSNKIIKNDFPLERSSMFFSGGVDSFDTLCTNYNDNPLLIMIWGSDIWIDDVDGWKTAKKNLDNISRMFNKDKTYIKSNFRRVINEIKLNEVFEKKLGDNWWHGVEHGMALLGHIAPLVPNYNIGCHYMPGTFSEKNTMVKCASYPTIDENFCISNCHVIHDGYCYTRLDKVKNIVKFLKEHKIHVKFRTCYKERSGKMNCSKCEKCYRTIMELVSIGEDPKKYGYEYNEIILENIKQLLIEQKFEHLTSSFNWKEIIDEIRKEKYYNKYDLSWIKDIILK